jgi:hypothetical protein
LANVPLRNTSGGIVASELPVGKHKVVYGASTDCQVGEAEAHFEVKDLTAPVAICDDELNISVGGSGIARVTVQDVDEGSWDNCQLESLELRRKLDDCLDAYLMKYWAYPAWMIFRVKSSRTHTVRKAPDGSVTWIHRK